jgi:hypothetical protein
VDERDLDTPAEDKGLDANLEEKDAKNSGNEEGN